MNRKQRRAARKQEGRAAPDSAPKAPEPWTALLAQASLCHQQGKLEDAAKLYRRALAIKPDHAQLHNNLGCVLLEQGEAGEASRHFQQALRLTPELFESYASVIALLIQLNPALAGPRTRAMEAWPRLVPLAELLDAGGLAAFVGDALLRDVLQAAPVRDIGFEALVTCLRAALLEQAIADDPAANDDNRLGFTCAIARQCFINEYIFATTPAEQAKIEDLQRSVVAAAATGRAVAPASLIALASYVPLGSIPNATSLLGRRWPAAVNDLLTQQLGEPEQERQLGELIPRLTSIEDEVSRRVRQQYEEHPYPRWVLAPSPSKPENLDDYLSRNFPGVPFREHGASGGVDILVAGCGTGAHTILAARRFNNASLLAIDLSLASLAYARRKAHELGLDQIEFAQADILQLGSLNRSFDVIDASGVLHHLEDPVQGWRILLSRLRPGGVMHVGLYSELARRDVVAARAFIAERGYRPTVDDIRRCRQDLMQTPLKSLTRAYDFFTTSECRDLLFHVQEHRLTIPQISAFIAAEGLTFIGFDLTPQIRQRYASWFPADRTMTDLGCWQRFETDNPETFAGMYQFWVQKP